MIGVLTKTGLGLKFTSILLSVSGGAKLPTMILTMVCCIILGMGLPTTAAFIITSTLCAPALIQLGITPMGAYMFAFYFGIVADVTPLLWRWPLSLRPDFLVLSQWKPDSVQRGLVWPDF